MPNEMITITRNNIFRQRSRRRRSFPCSSSLLSKILVSKETVVLRRWEIETEIDCIKRVDKGRITTVKDLES